MNKNDLRKEMLLKRSKFDNKEKISTIIVDKIIKLPIYQQSNVIALYNSMKNEVNTTSLINYLLNCGKIVLLPRVVGKELVFFKISKDTIYEKSSFRVIEPIYQEKDVYNDKIDLAIIPGVAFDYQNNRLGYGCGYYDRFLMKHSCFKIGICFSCQMVNTVYANEFDVKMDLVINEDIVNILSR